MIWIGCVFFFFSMTREFTRSLHLLGNHAMCDENSIYFTGFKFGSYNVLYIFANHFVL